MVGSEQVLERPRALVWRGLDIMNLDRSQVNVPAIRRAGHAPSEEGKVWQD